MLGGFYDEGCEIQDLELRFERVRAEFERQPPKPSNPELVFAGNNTIEVRAAFWLTHTLSLTEPILHPGGKQIKWTPLANDSDLLYAAEIQHWCPPTRNSNCKLVRDNEAEQHLQGWWDLSVSDSKNGHRFHRLRSGEIYCVRVRCGFRKTQWGDPSRPLFVKLPSRSQPERVDQSTLSPRSERVQASGLRAVTPKRA